MNKPFDRTRFTKVLALAESEHDGEALAAVRKAVVMARAAGLSLGEAVGTGTDSDTALDLHALTLKLELSAARREIADLRRQLVGRTDEARLDAAHVKGYERGHAAGKAEGMREAKMEANRRVREVEAELEAYRAPMDWVELAERFAFKNQRGVAVAFAKGVLYRAKTNKLTPTDQAELRKFAAPPKRGRKAKATEEAAA